VLLVARIGDRCKEVLIARFSANIFGRTGIGTSDALDRPCARFGQCDAFDLDCMFPAIAAVEGVKCHCDNLRWNSKRIYFRKYDGKVRETRSVVGTGNF